jgi:hypothetical protein
VLIGEGPRSGDVRWGLPVTPQRAFQLRQAGYHRVAHITGTRKTGRMARLNSERRLSSSVIFVEAEISLRFPSCLNGLINRSEGA